MFIIIMKTTYQIPPNLNICLSSSQINIIQIKIIVIIFRLNTPHQRVSIMLISKFQLREDNSNHGEAKHTYFLLLDCPYINPYLTMFIR